MIRHLRWEETLWGPFRDSFTYRFLSSLRARLMLLHPSPNCSLRAENLVHVHFKEEIGIAELIPLVTTYIILFAYIYFSTRRSQDELLHDTHLPAVGNGLEPRAYLAATKAKASFLPL